MNRCRVLLRTEGSIVVATLEGEVDLFASGELGFELSKVPNDSVGLVLDLSGVPYIDSAGLRTIFDVARRLKTARQGIVICVPEESPLRRLLKVTNVEAVIPLAGTMEGSLDLLRASSV